MEKLKISGQESSNNDYWEVNFSSGKIGFNKSLFIAYKDFPRLIELFHDFLKEKGLDCKIDDPKEF